MKVFIISDSHYVISGISSLLKKEHDVQVLTHSFYSELHPYAFSGEEKSIIYFHLNSIHQISGLLINKTQRISVLFSPNFESLINTVLWPETYKFIRLDSKLDKLIEFISPQDEYINAQLNNKKTTTTKLFISASELEIITLTSKSWSCHRIAKDKNKNYKTVNGQRTSAMKKLGFSNKIKFSKYLTTINYHS